VDWRHLYYKKYYADRPGWKPGTEEFHELCGSHLRRGGRILEIGAGPGNATSSFLARLGPVHGIDPDSAVLSNPALESASVMNGEAFQVPAASFDACVSNYVIEHLRDPARHLAEVARAIKPGGVYIFRTVNKRHYVPLLARLSPHWLHVLVANRARGLPASAHDPYPTTYRMNSASVIKRLAKQAGLEVESLRFVEKEPSYGMFSRPAFLLFMVYERMVNSTSILEGARVNIFGVLKRP
jgi:SAM-dependent methyltransferase